jgi:hypothetical protein
VSGLDWLLTFCCSFRLFFVFFGLFGFWFGFLLFRRFSRYVLTGTEIFWLLREVAFAVGVDIFFRFLECFDFALSFILCMSFDLPDFFVSGDELLFGVFVGREFFDHSDNCLDHIITLFWEVAFNLKIG